MQRFRRLRQNQALRDLVAETRLDVRDLIYPLFVIEGTHIKQPVDSMPGVYRYSIDELDPLLKEIDESGISGILIFGVPKVKDAVGSEAYHDHGIVQEAIRYIKSKYPRLLIVADICLCEYTSHGHCGLINKERIILNDETLPLLAKMANTVVDAGADLVAPSDMMDGDVASIRAYLDAHGHKSTPIMGYSAKYASGYFSPFRYAANSVPEIGRASCRERV